MDVCFAAHVLIPLIVVFPCNGKENGTRSANAMLLIRRGLVTIDPLPFVVQKARRVRVDTSGSVLESKNPTGFASAACGRYS
jgi:hypothetical protein